MILRLGNGLSIHTVVLGELMTNCYVLVHDSLAAACWTVDPAFPVRPLMDLLARKNLTVERILLTHGHGDHLGGVGSLKQLFPQAIITAPSGEAAMLTDPAANLSLAFGVAITAPPADELIRPGDHLAMGELDWQVLDVSGHTSDGVAFYCAQAGVAISGDSLFAGSIGRSDLPGGDEAKLIRNIKQNLFTLPPETKVLPGHGPPTIIGQEIATNPFLR